MVLLLQRQDATDDRTIGKLSIVGGTHWWFSLEDCVRTGPKVQGATAIPAGRYEVTITKSQRFGVMLPLLLDVPNFTGIRIHPGNVAADTEGCILIGLSRENDSILSSRIAMGQLQPFIASQLARGERVYIDVKDPVVQA
jgi:hypothetical protein